MERFVWTSLYGILGIVLVVMQKKRYRTYRTPLTLFCGVWVIIGFFANTSILNYDMPSTLVNACILIGVIVFFIAFVGRNPSVGEIKKNIDFGTEKSLNMPLIIVFNAIGWFILLPRLITSMRLVLQFGFSFVRANLTNMEFGLSRGGMQDIIFSYMVEPIFVVTGVIATFELISRRRKRAFYLFVYSTISIILFSLASAGRGLIVKFVFYVGLTIMIARCKVLETIIKSRVLKYGLLGAIVVVLFISIERSFSSEGDSLLESWLKTFYIYYFSGPAFMSKLIEAQPQYAFGGKLLWGSASFGFISNWFAYLIQILTGNKIGSDYLLGSLIANNYYQVAPGIKVNAMYTCFYTFALDWGYLGILIGPCILGLLSSFLFKKVYFSNSYRFAVIYVTWLYILIRTVFKLDTLTISYTVTIMCVFLFIRRDDKCHKIQSAIIE